MRVIVFLTLCVAAITAIPTDPQRIIGGSTTTIQTYPHMAALLYSATGSNFRQSCGGIIINQKCVLTAAHCVFRESIARWRIRVGSTKAHTGGAVHSLFNYHFHPNFNFMSRDSDIAIVRIPGTIVYNNAVQPASFAGANYNLGDNQPVWAVGWGVTTVNGRPSEDLRHVQIWSVNQSTCVSRYRGINWAITDNMFCAGWLGVGGRDQCQGDSGGPVYHNRVVIGVTSFGLRCADPYYPGVNVRVSRFISWIQSTAA